MRKHKRFTPVAILMAVGIVLASCSSGSSTSTTTTTSSASKTVTGSATVSAAASLTEAFGTIQTNIETKNPGATLTINFGSSGVLEQQIESGAPVDVAAFADEPTMQKLADKNLLAAPAKIFATNHLVIVTKPGNPMNIKSLKDLETAGTISLCADSAPCGVYADQILQQAGVTIPETSITRGEDVKSTLAAVSQGDANAGIVYVTDAKAAGSAVEAVPIPPAQNALAKYPIAVIKATSNKSVAQAFMNYVLAPQGQAVLRSYGFLAP
jgi:molybdate transport system substrate-binding protein